MFSNWECTVLNLYCDKRRDIRWNIAWVLGISQGLRLYNSVQMFDPFRDRNPHFFGPISLSWFVMQDFWKWISSMVLCQNHSGNFFWGEIWIFVEVIFNDPTKNWVLGLTLRVMLLSRCNLNTCCNAPPMCWAVFLTQWIKLLHLRYQTLKYAVFNRPGVVGDVL